MAKLVLIESRCQRQLIWFFDLLYPTRGGARFQADDDDGAEDSGNDKDLVTWTRDNGLVAGGRADFSMINEDCDQDSPSTHRRKTLQHHATGQLAESQATTFLT